MNDDLTLIADGMQEIVIRRPGSDFEAIVAKALVRPFRSRRHVHVQESLFPALSAHWYLSRTSTPFEPLVGDEIEDGAGNRWTVLEVNRSELNETWQCVARAYTARFGLDEHVDLLRTAYTKSSGGALDRGFRVLKTGIAAKFSSATQTLDGVRKETFYLLTRDPFDAELRDVLRRADGTLFEIESIRKPLYENGWTEIRLVKEN